MRSKVTALTVAMMLVTVVAGLALAQDGPGTTPSDGTGTTAPAAGDDAPTPAPTADPTVPPATPAASPATTAAGTAEDGLDAGTYAVRLRDLEQRINELKEQIFRSKTRLSLLAETVLKGVVAGAQAVIVHENRMSSSYRLIKATYSLDGARIFSNADEEGSLGDRRELSIYDGSIVPGEHTLTVNLEYRGNGYGIFRYLKGYRFKVRSNHSFTAPEGKAVTIRVIGYEKGGPTAPLEERPAIRYVERVDAMATAQERADDDGEGQP